MHLKHIHLRLDTCLRRPGCSSQPMNLWLFSHLFLNGVVRGSRPQEQFQDVFFENHLVTLAIISTLHTPSHLTRASLFVGINLHFSTFIYLPTTIFACPTVCESLGKYYIRNIWKPGVQLFDKKAILGSLSYILGSSICRPLFWHAAPIFPNNSITPVRCYFCWR